MSSITALGEKKKNNQKLLWLQALTGLLDESLLVRLIFVSGHPTFFTLDTSGVTEVLRDNTEI